MTQEEKIYFGKLIKEGIGKMSVSDFSAMAGVSESTLFHYIQGSAKNPRQNTVQQIARAAERATGMDPNRILKAAGFECDIAISDQQEVNATRKLPFGIKTGYTIVLNHLLQNNPDRYYNIRTFKFAGSIIIRDTVENNGYLVLPAFYKKQKLEEIEISIIERVSIWYADMLRNPEELDIILLFITDSEDVQDILYKYAKKIKSPMISYLTNDYLTVNKIINYEKEVMENSKL